MQKRIAALAIVVILFLAGCQPISPYTKYRGQFNSSFDTITTIIGYAETQEAFDDFTADAEARFLELHKLFDIYHTYEGMNNIKTVNDSAGVAPVVVDPLLLDLVDLCKEWYVKTDGIVNIALGPVLQVWHDYREEYKGDTASAKLPTEAELQAAAQFCDINKVIVDRAAGTLYLAEAGMRLDVGAAAKGYAAQVVADEMKRESVPSFLISAGGNVIASGAPKDGNRDTWGIGLQDPEAEIMDNNDNLDILFLNDTSAVTSGDYQRYYVVNGEKQNHIIDPRTLHPAQHVAAVTVIVPDSGVADILSTTLFILTQEEGKALIESLGYDAVWISHDNVVTATEGAQKLMKSYGATNKVSK